MRTRQRGWQSETRALTLGSILSAGQTRSQARRAGNCRTRPRSVSSVQRKARLSFFHGTPPFASEPLDAKSRHGPSAGAVIRITGPQKISVALSGTVFLRASPVTPTSSHLTAHRRRINTGGHTRSVVATQAVAPCRRVQARTGSFDPQAMSLFVLGQTAQKHRIGTRGRYCAFIWRVQSSFLTAATAQFALKQSASAALRIDWHRVGNLSFVPRDWSRCATAGHLQDPVAF